MRTTLALVSGCVAAVLASAHPFAVQASVRGVTTDQILVGLEGPTDSFSSDEENLGMRLVMAEANARGGIHGRRLVERSYPRKGGAAIDEGVANARRLIEDDKVFVLFNMGGPASVRIAPLAMSHQVPFLFPHTALLTHDADRYVFTSFPSYEGETAVMFKHLAGTRGLKRLAIVHDENEYGSYFRDRLVQLASSLGYQMVGAEGLTDRKPGDLTAAVGRLRAARPEAVVLALYPEQAQAVMRAKAALGWQDVRMVATGPLSDEQYLNVDGGAAEGTIGFCLYPDPNQDQSAGVREYRRLMAVHFPGHPLNRYSLYGYVFGSIAAEALKRSGQALTTDSFVTAMESIKNWDSGGIIPPVTLSATNHHAQRAGFICELKNGRFEAATGWLVP